MENTIEKVAEIVADIDEAHAPITLLVPVKLHRRLRDDPEFRKKLVKYMNEENKENTTNESI